jgi:hypothetical protein
MTRPSESDVAWGNFLSQHINAKNAENVVRPIFQPMDPAGQGLDAMRTQMDYSAVTGDRLDKIGSIVGANRYLPQGLKLVFFGFITQEAGRGFGQARMRHENEPLAEAYTLNDVEYRQIIKAKIALNNGHGTAREIEDAAKIAFRAPVASARDAGPGAIELWIGRIPGADEGLGRVIPDFLPRLAGVRISIKFWNPQLPFGFSNNKHFGFGVGIMARTPLT